MAYFIVTFLFLLATFAQAQNFCIPTDTARAAALINKGRTAATNQQLDSALSYYQQSKSIFINAYCWTEAAKVATNIVLTSARLPNKTIYKAELNNALLLAQNHLTDNDSVKAKIYQIVGTDFLQRQSLDSALLFLQSAQNIFKTANAWRSYVLVCRALSQVAQVKQDYKMMEIFINQGYSVTQNQLNNSPEQLSAILQLYGALYYRTGEYDKALLKMQQGLEINKQNLRNKQDTSSLISFYNNIGLLYIELGDVYKAEGYCMNAMMLSTQTGDYFKGATIRYNLAESFKLRGDSLKAYENYNKGLILLQKIDTAATIQQSAENYNRSLINLRNGKAEVSAALNQYLQAIEAITANLKLHINEPFRKEETYRILSELYAQQSEWAKAVAAMQSSLTQSKLIYGDFHPIVARAYLLMGNLYKKQNLLTNALPYYQKCLTALTPNFKAAETNQSPKSIEISDKELYLEGLSRPFSKNIAQSCHRKRQ